MNDFNFEPVNGLNDMTQFPTNPGSEAAARNQFMVLFNQVKDYINSNIMSKINVTTKTYTDSNGTQVVEKWPDGKMKITIDFKFNAEITAEWGGMFYYEIDGPNFKEAFKTPPLLLSIAPGASSLGYQFLVSLGHKTKTGSAQRINIMRPTVSNMQEFKVTYVYEGRWK